MAAKIAAWGRKSDYGDDEAFLAQSLWPEYVHDCLVHDGCYAKPRFGERFGTILPFPTEREFGRFVGERCHEDEHWGHDDRDALFLANENR